MMECILFRHGIAIDRVEWTGEEPDRPLSEKGAAKTKQGVGGLLRLDIAPTHILSSPLTRAQDTAKILQESLQARVPIRLCDELVPDAHPDKLVSLLHTLPPEACVVCVGHEPHLGDVAGLMLFGKSAPGLSLKKAGACSIYFEDSPKAAEGVLHWWLTPGQLRSLRKK
ncbi:MAG: SixA phosphatase family protein [Nitrospiraceae bacterium]